MKPTNKHWRKKTPAAHRSYGQKRNRDNKIRDFDQEDLGAEFFVDLTNIPSEITDPVSYPCECENTLPDDIGKEEHLAECGNNLPDEVNITPIYDGFNGNDFPCEVKPDDIKKKKAK